MPEPVRVTCLPASDGWNCEVAVGAGADVTRHDVAVSQSALQSLALGSDDPQPLVEASIAFLLERESKHSILRSFEIGEIQRYFPDYATEIKRRLST